MFLLQQEKINVSFEFFPPSSVKLTNQLWDSIIRLSPLAPSFVSVTYGAGGSTRERTFETVKRIIDETELTPAAHLTCVGSSREELSEIANQYWEIGVRHLVALRGDKDTGDKNFIPHPEGFRNAGELVTCLREIANFEISVAAYPEVHPDAISAESDLDNLAYKIDCGATRAITQFFFDIDTFLRFRDSASKRGIEAQIVPGILPVTNFERLKKFTDQCGTTLPEWLKKMLNGLDEDPDSRRLIAGWIAIDQCIRLSENGVKDFHFYTLNRAELTRAICHALGLRDKKI